MALKGWLRRPYHGLEGFCSDIGRFFQKGILIDFVDYRSICRGFSLGLDTHPDHGSLWVMATALVDSHPFVVHRFQRCRE